MPHPAFHAQAGCADNLDTHVVGTPNPGHPMAPPCFPPLHFSSLHLNIASNPHTLEAEAGGSLHSELEASHVETNQVQ